MIWKKNIEIYVHKGTRAKIIFSKKKHIFSSRGSRGERKKSRDRTRESREARLPGSITGSEVKSDVHEPHVSMLV